MTREQHRTNSLGLCDRGLDELLDRIEASGGGPSRQRFATRWGFRLTAVDVTLTQPAGTTIGVRMACRNISKTGIGLLHRAYVHVGTSCVVSIDGAYGSRTRVTGRVARCMHLTGMVHEVGVQFDEPIDVRGVVRPDPTQEISAIENIDPATLKGAILVVDPCGVTLKLVKHFLKATQLRVRHAESTADAVAIARDGIGLVLCDSDLGPEETERFVKNLHDLPTQTPPVIILSTDTTAQTRALIHHPGVNGFIAKPFTQDFLVRTVAEFYAEPDASAAAGDVAGFQADRQIVAELLPELRRFADELERLVGESPDKVRPTLLQIAGIAPVLGLTDLAIHVESVAHAVTVGLKIEKLTAEVEGIARECRAAADR